MIFKGSTLLLMGSADKLPEKPTEQVKFVEDLPENEAAAVSNHFTQPCWDHVIQYSCSTHVV